MNRKKMHLNENLSDDRHLGCRDASFNGCKCNSSSFTPDRGNDIGVRY